MKSKRSTWEACRESKETHQREGASKTELERVCMLSRQIGESMHGRRCNFGEKQEEKNGEEERAAACVQNNFSLT